MDYKTLNNGVKIPEVGFGVFQIKDEEECIRVILDAIKAGYRLIDTAQSYGNEEAVGKAVKLTDVSREELFITTKVWISNAGYEKAKASILASLEKMQLDYIDMVLIHQAVSDYYGTYRAMTELYKEGKIKAIGVSNFLPDDLADMCLFNDIVPAVNQIEVNPWHQQITAVPVNEQYGVQVEAWASFAQGKHDLFKNATLQAIGDHHGKSIAQVILRWLIQRNIIPLCKSFEYEQMKENLDVFDFELNDDEMEQIKTLDMRQSAFFELDDPASIKMLSELVR